MATPQPQVLHAGRPGRSQPAYTQHGSSEEKAEGGGRRVARRPQDAGAETSRAATRPGRRSPGRRSPGNKFRAKEPSAAGHWPLRGLPPRAQLHFTHRRPAEPRGSGKPHGVGSRSARRDGRFTTWSPRVHPGPVARAACPWRAFLSPQWGGNRSVKGKEGGRAEGGVKPRTLKPHPPRSQATQALQTRPPTDDGHRWLRREFSIH